MRFLLIDRIVELEAGRKITALKNLSLAEEYLADHFPGFPVMPGVLMLEAITQAGAWLIRASEDFRNSIILMKEARTVKYGSFVEPGRQLTIQAEIVEHDEVETVLKGKGMIDGAMMVTARVTLKRFNLADRDPVLAAADRNIIQHLRDLYSILRMGSVAGKIESATSSGRVQAV